MLGPFIVHLRRALARAGYETAVAPSPPTATRGSKQVMLDGVCDLTLHSDTIFEAFVGVADYSDAVRHDWHFGMIRVQQQERAVDALLRDPAAPVAWALTTAYYSAFFAALELVRVGGRYVTHLEDDESRLIAQNAVLAPGVGRAVLESGAYTGTAHYDPHESGVRIRFRKTGEPAHASVWHSLCESAEQARRATSHPTMERFCELVGASSRSRWPHPNRTRNDWNYRNVRRYVGDAGSAGRQLRALLGSTPATESWAMRSKLHPSDENLASAVQFVRAALVATALAVDRELRAA